MGKTLRECKQICLFLGGCRSGFSYSHFLGDCRVPQIGYPCYHHPDLRAVYYRLAGSVQRPARWKAKQGVMCVGDGPSGEATAGIMPHVRIVPVEDLARCEEACVEADGCQGGFSYAPVSNECRIAEAGYRCIESPAPPLHPATLYTVVARWKRLRGSVCTDSFDALDGTSLDGCMKVCLARDGCAEGFSFLPRWRKCRLPKLGATCNPGPAGLDDFDDDAPSLSSMSMSMPGSAPPQAQAQGSHYFIQDVDDCLGNPCQGAHTVCEDTGEDSYRCACAPGWGGPSCLQDINECALGVAGGFFSPGDAGATAGSALASSSSFGGSLALGDYGGSAAADGGGSFGLSAAAAPCSAHATCRNTAGSFQCTCVEDFTGDGVFCEPVDQCGAAYQQSIIVPLSAKCDTVHGRCIDGFGSFSCECLPGYRGDGHVCVDVDECADGVGGCAPGEGVAICTNTPGSFTCACGPGYTGDGYNCSNVDDCAAVVARGTCGAHSACRDLVGGHACDCLPGYNRAHDSSGGSGGGSGSGSGGSIGGLLAAVVEGACVDVDECSTLHTPCAGHGRCSNTGGAYECECDAGYVLVGAGLTATAGQSPTTRATAAAAAATPARMRATAPTRELPVEEEETATVSAAAAAVGWRMRRRRPERRALLSLPSAAAGRRRIEVVPAAGTAAAAAAAAATPVPVLECRDVDECAAGTHDCDEHAICTNTAGGYECQCRKGWEAADEDDAATAGHGANACVDIDECAVRDAAGNAPPPYDCGGRGICINLVGSWTCKCVQGYAPASSASSLHSSAGTQGSAAFLASAPTVADATGADADAADTDTPLLGCVDIDECAAPPPPGTDAEAWAGPCAAHATCKNTDGSFACLCGDGYIGDGSPGSICVDRNECVEQHLDSGGGGVHPAAACHDHSICFNTQGSYVCKCKVGYTGDGEAHGLGCTEINDCDLRGPGPDAPQPLCGDHAKCVDGPDVQDSKCVCLPGYAPGPGGGGIDTTGCIDIDECKHGNGDDVCDARMPHSICRNTVGSFDCICDRGYVRYETSAHVAGGGRRRMLLGASLAAASAVDASAVDASAVASVAAADDDAAAAAASSASADDGANATAVPVPTPTPPPTPAPPVVSCMDANECEMTADSKWINTWWALEPSYLAPECGKANATCQNTPGSFTCDCGAGMYASKNHAHSAGAAGGVGPVLCLRDADECADGTDECSANAYCLNTQGSYQCVCNSGYVGNGFKCDKDVDECTTEPGICGASGRCINKAPGYTCVCNDPGFEGAYPDCTDVDECAEGKALKSPMCKDKQQCINLPGTYTCECPAGLVYDKPTKACRDLDECACQGHWGDATMPECKKAFAGFVAKCDLTNAVCSNNHGGFSCACKDGMSGDGKTCVNIDECAAGTHDCAATSVCVDLPPPHKWSCACKPGFSGDGRHCENIDDCPDNKCAHGASCHDDATTVHAYVCDCTAGYAGKLCEEDVDECAIGAHFCDPVAGLCANQKKASPSDAGYTCSCRTGWTGNGFSCRGV